jgi:hypothetical protein
MARIPADRSDRVTRLVYDATTNYNSKDRDGINVKSCPIHLKAILAIYHYLLKGIRILGEAYSTYDDRNNQ